MVRDSLDIIPFLCGHYLRLGFERLVFIDDCSSDGTFEFLDNLSRKTSRIEVRRVFHSRLEQKAEVNSAVEDSIPGRITSDFSV